MRKLATCGQCELPIRHEFCSKNSSDKLIETTCEEARTDKAMFVEEIPNTGNRTLLVAQQLSDTSCYIEPI